ncbi:glutathione S- transferase, nitrogen catabolite repression regulator [Pseudogymnoascus verrucosus]|uniref:glutathione transferase n=1 Tax=Pseudogymnoascus verrucosus TaxID=342668 RepID=A0A1B8G7P2_9PEZI|nr:glutathione S- transferase, nitrogen catabolite repression regulator [Pseudogymnoascus verrucosus]OBT91856.1 glutathione S- transferase, nitrogen catabolite repression regulator [Pseudogymnoascus verrucosus]
MSLKPITLWGHDSGSNAWKVAMVLEELSVPYTVKIIDFPDMKKEAYESINPNGRVPSIEDPNTGITLWESGAIIEYLVETYDKQNNFNFASGSKEYYEAKQWLYYQVSGQGPYFGQAVWFTLYHPEKLPSVVDRYVNEIRRVSGVLNGVLQGREFLVGGKYSYADASFVMWYAIAPLFADRINLATDFPALNAWLERIKARPAISKIIKDREAAMAASK